MSESAQGTTVLVVDDESSLLSALGEFLVDKGWVTLVAQGGAEALGIVQSYPDDIDLLVTDVVMAGMDGFTLAAQAAAERPSIKILYMSGYVTDNQRVRQGLREAGRFVLEKPFGRDEFVEMVETTLSRSVDATDAFAVILANPFVTAQVVADQAAAGSERSTRYAVELPLRYRWTRTRVWRVGRTRNISRTGLEFDVAPPLPDMAPVKDDPEIELRLELPDPGAVRAEVMAAGRVTRVDTPDADAAEMSVAVAVKWYRTDIRR
jgi:DNA-binding response OmpR family regulator